MPLHHNFVTNLLPVLSCCNRINDVSALTGLDAVQTNHTAIVVGLANFGLVTDCEKVAWKSPAIVNPKPLAYASKLESRRQRLI